VCRAWPQLFQRGENSSGGLNAAHGASQDSGGLGGLGGGGGGGAGGLLCADDTRLRMDDILSAFGADPATQQARHLRCARGLACTPHCVSCRAHALTNKPYRCGTQILAPLVAPRPHSNGAGGAGGAGGGARFGLDFGGGDASMGGWREVPRAPPQPLQQRPMAPPPAVAPAAWAPAMPPAAPAAAPAAAAASPQAPPPPAAAAAPDDALRSRSSFAAALAEAEAQATGTPGGAAQQQAVAPAAAAAEPLRPAFPALPALPQGLDVNAFLSTLNYAV
jgi:hypothetical protein